ncbi:pkinase-domain-containing protein [Ceraceosorus bombacis]|uniref:Pkinase-domain-containing protein n=1 Tax=Ceraceosorus bombacis TaxID=401625 RepID=A0A0P1BMX5_9BASI|nr:pkinase-domain-containing protein [Ceraceosorus bombacis]
MGVHRLTGTRVAIKQVPKAHSASLTREIHHHRRLHHPHVMQLYEVIATESNIWMVSELCAGGELYDYLVERGTMPEPEARRLFGQLCLAVAYIHGRGIVHRDLKLENVLLDERCNVKLGDFGFTREFEGKRLMDTFCGTTGYAAPEMLAGKKYTGEEVDIWSLGVILYALLCGTLPFDDDDEAVMKQKILACKFDLPDLISEESKDLLSSVLQLDPTSRPSIKSILSHPWFSKIMISSPMSPLDEDAAAAEPSYFANPPPSSSDPRGEELNPKPSDPAAGERNTPADGAREELSAATDAQADASSPPASTETSYETAPTRSFEEPLDSSHQVTTISPLPNGSKADRTSVEQLGARSSHPSNFSEASFHTVMSDSGSSDQRSSRTGGTSPITDSTSEHDEPTGSGGEGSGTSPNRKSSTASGESTDTALTKTRGLALHKNESQTTIRREGSNGSDVSRGRGSSIAVPAGKAGKAAASTLPTHHEGPAALEESAESETEDVHTSSRPPSALSARLARAGSQSSARGHARTPSRTKRRSLSSGGLSDHHPPHLAPKPVNYVALLEDASPALFTSVVEQNLLHSLSNLGLDVGQVVHSVLTDACDASGGLWWLLKLKASDAQDAAIALPASAGSVVSNSAPRLGAAPPPIPIKDPNRPSSTTASPSKKDEILSEASMTPRATSVRGKPAKVPPLKIAKESERPSTAPALTPTSDTGKFPSTTIAESASTQTEGNAPIGPIQIVPRPVRADRNRTSSFSIKLSSVLANAARKDSGDGAGEDGDDMAVPERSKSPVSMLFGSRKGGGTVKDKARQGSPAAPSTALPASRSALANLNTGSKLPDGTPSPRPKKDPARDRERIRSLMAGKEADDDESLTQGSPRPLTKSPGTPGKAKASSRLELSAPMTKSVDTFSTVSSTNDEAKSSTSKTRLKSNFLSTVRTWLGAEDKQGKRRRKANASGSSTKTGSVYGHDGSLHQSSVARRSSVSRRANPYPTGSMAGPVRSPRSPQRGSLSRRSSSGSAHLFDGHLGGGPPIRPVNLRRQSAGSITPTATLHGGDAAEFAHFGALQRSRPSSSQSLHRPPHAGLHHKQGSASSSGSFMRQQQQQGSMRGAHSRRPSTDGGTTVRRHRQYPSVHSLTDRPRSEASNSRPSSLYAPAVAEENEEGSQGGHGAATPRRVSLESRSAMAEGSQGRASPVVQHAHAHAPHRASVFVAHKSRSPYGPPSASPMLQSTLHSKLSSPNPTPAADGEPPAAGTGMWRRSWGRPPPSWAGPVDMGPTRSELAAAALIARPKLRDVFADREDDEWEDEDDEPTYAGGLGQLDSFGSGWRGTSRNTAGSGFESMFGGTNSGRGVSGLPPTSTTAFGTPSRIGLGSSEGSLLSSGRYAGVRSIFQPPSLGRDTAPRLLSMQMNADEDASAGSALGSAPDTNSADKSTLGAPSNKDAPANNLTGVAPAAPASGLMGTGTARLRGQTPAFKTITIEEEEEDE